MKLSLTSLNKAVSSLKKAVVRFKNEPDDDIVRDSVIQRFEYTYSLSIKLIQRYLSQNMPLPEEQSTFNNIIRQADKIGLLKHDLSVWTEYREMRNTTSHTYDEDKARLVSKVAMDFLNDAEYLLYELQNRNNS
jgi:nucleotidyltransferase substrate binding protein (TIGR01987 family)